MYCPVSPSTGGVGAFHPEIIFDHTIHAYRLILFDLERQETTSYPLSCALQKRLASRPSDSHAEPDADKEYVRHG
jgi:hypothetical protein